MYARCYSRSLPVDDVIALVGLEDKRRARVKTRSGGQRRRLDLALALVGDPDLIFLDERTTGFDPAARHGTVISFRLSVPDASEQLPDRLPLRSWLTMAGSYCGPRTRRTHC